MKKDDSRIPNKNSNDQTHIIPNTAELLKIIIEEAI